MCLVDEETTNFRNKFTSAHKSLLSEQIQLSALLAFQMYGFFIILQLSCKEFSQYNYTQIITKLC